jgi:hypothetical protein
MTTGDGGPQQQNLAAAISALAAALAPKPEAPAKPDRWKAIGAFVGTMLPSVVMFVIGYIFIQGVELDLKREEFTADAADKLKTYVETLMTAAANEPPEKLRATALALGGFGGVAVLPLVSVIRSGGEQKVASAMLGLEQAGRVAPDETCPLIAVVIDNATGAYRWETRKAVTEVAGLVGCPAAEEPLRRLLPDIGKLGLTNDQKSNFEKTVTQALERIQALERRDASWW